MRFSASPTARRPLNLEDADRYRGWLADLLIRRTGVPAQEAYTEVHSPRYDLIPREDDSRYTEPYVDRVFVVWADRIEEQVQVQTGAPFGDAAGPETMSVWVNRRYLDERGLEVGERYEIGDAYDATRPRVPHWMSCSAGNPSGSLSMSICAHPGGTGTRYWHSWNMPTGSS